MIAKSEFKTRFKTGFDIIDNQHRILFDLINDIAHATKAGVNHKVLDALLGIARDYAFHHFQAEEDMLTEHENYKDHCLEHYKLIKQLNTFILDFRNKREKGHSSVSPFLENWLILHIEQHDIPALTQKTTEIPLIFDGSVIDDFETFAEERRRHARIPSSEVVEGEIPAHCYNATQLKSSTVRIINMTPGGLLLGATSGHEVSDLLIIACSIGKNFKMKEKVLVKSVKGKSCGVEFIAPAEETVNFFTNLYGAVHLNRARIS